MLPLRQLALALSSNPLVAVAGGVAAAGAAAVLLFPRAFPKFDLVLPWVSGAAMARLESNGKEHRYVGYATCASLPGHPWLALLPGLNCKSRRDFRRFSKDALLHDFWKEGAHRKAMAFYKLYGVGGGKKAPFNHKFTCTYHDIEYITHDYWNTVLFWKALRATMPESFRGALLASESSMYRPSFSPRRTSHLKGGDSDEHSDSD